MVEWLWFAIYKTIIAYLINQMVVPPLGYISLYKAPTGMGLLNRCGLLSTRQL